MTASRNPATPDPMALLCLIGGAVRAAGEWNLLMQLIIIANLCPAIRCALLAWLATEERFAGLEFAEEPGIVEDGWGGPDGYFPARMTPKGRMVLWRHVTRFGLAVMIPVITAALIRLPNKAMPRQLCSRGDALSPLSFFQIFCPAGGPGPSTSYLLRYRNEDQPASSFDLGALPQLMRPGVLQVGHTGCHCVSAVWQNSQTQPGSALIGSGSAAS